VVECYVPEAELSQVVVGKDATIVPLAYPGLQLKGRVETVGSMAQAKPGHADWQKYFGVTLAVEKPDDCLRSGMSVNARIMSYQKSDAILVPRTAVQWEDDKSCCRVRRLRGTETRPVQLGRANTKYFEVLQGLAPGEIVVE
jgi:multidrug efflux pump subunit AcrA (membrane-fusion protein)